MIDMDRKEIIKLFNNEKCKESTFKSLFYTNKLLECKVFMKNHHKIIVMFNDGEEIYADIDDHYFSLGGTLISPIKDIIKIDIRWI